MKPGRLQDVERPDHVDANALGRIQIGHGPHQCRRMDDMRDLVFLEDRKDARDVQEIGEFDIDLVLDRPDEVPVQVAGHDDRPMPFLNKFCSDS